MAEDQNKPTEQSASADDVVYQVLDFERGQKRVRAWKPIDGGAWRFSGFAQVRLESPQLGVLERVITFPIPDVGTVQEAFKQFDVAFAAELPHAQAEIRHQAQQQMSRLRDMRAAQRGAKPGIVDAAGMPVPPGMLKG